MEKFVLTNGIKVLYEYRPGSITSFCIGFNAGALEERGFSLGIAHAVEHMVFKGTPTRKEYEINRSCDEIFGFHNAMTNYPYAIYYGTTNSSDFERGFEIYCDFLLNPLFPEEGFKEEMSVICEELKEWSEDPAQHCEDCLLASAFKVRRIKDLIIGTESGIKNITLEEIKRFYERFYAPGNCVISVVSSLGRDGIERTIMKYLGKWRRDFSGIESEGYEKNNSGLYTEDKKRESVKIKLCFPISGLSFSELEAVSVFSCIFGEGVSSILYDEIRTKHGLAYEVNSEVKRERGIELFTIYVGTSKENAERVLNIINNKTDEACGAEDFYCSGIIATAVSRLKLKRELALEKSIELSKKLTTYELMYGDARRVFKECSLISDIKPEFIKSTVRKVLRGGTTFILK